MLLSFPGSWVLICTVSTPSQECNLEGENFAEKKELGFFGSKVLLAEASARGRVSKHVANLGMEDKISLKSQES